MTLVTTQNRGDRGENALIEKKERGSALGMPRRWRKCEKSINRSEKDKIGELQSCWIEIKFFWECKINIGVVITPQRNNVLTYVFMLYRLSSQITPTVGWILLKLWPKTLTDQLAVEVLPALSRDLRYLQLITWSNLHQFWKFLCLNISERSEESTQGVSFPPKTRSNSQVDRNHRFCAISHYNLDL